MSSELLLAVVPAAIGWIAARWIPSHSRLLRQAADDLELAKQLGTDPLARELHDRATQATRSGLRRRDSNDAGRNLALLAIIGVAGSVFVPLYARAFPGSISGWRGPVMLGTWGFYLLFVLAAAVGGVIWWVHRLRTVGD